MASERSAGQLAVAAHYNHAVPLTQHQEKIMVEITGPSTEKGQTASLDLVVVLDISRSMHGPKLHDMKNAAEFIIRKMGELDTLTFVRFSSRAWKPSAKQPAHMRSRAKHQARDFVRALTADSHGDANIRDGLHTAVHILRDHLRGKTRSAAGIFLMSDRKQDIGDPRDVHVDDFPVFTFGFGHQHGHHLLYDIAHKSHGGTYHNISHSSDRNRLLRYFAKVLGILRDVSALNLAVTLKPHPGATILRVEPGKYRISCGADGSSTIHFGELARKEPRKILVVLQLPSIHHNETAKTVMTVECKYRLPQEEIETTKSLPVKMSRHRDTRLHSPMGHFQVELARREQAHRIGNMKSLADDGEFDKAMDELAAAKNALEQIDSTHDDCARLLHALSVELEHLKDLLKSHEVYNEYGRAYMLAAILSHDRQRFAARGRDDDVMLYVLQRMSKYAGEADKLHLSADGAQFSIPDKSESRGNIAFFTSYRPPVPLDIFCCQVPASRKGEFRLTDGKFYNYNCRPVPPEALKVIIRRLQVAPNSEPITVTDREVDSRSVTGSVFVSEREHGLETLHVALRFVAKETVKVFSLAEIYGSDLFGGARLEDNGCFAGGYEVDGRTIDHHLVYVSTKEAVQERRSPWNVVYTTNLKTGETKRLTPAGTSDLSPSVSPCGKKIAVASFQWKKWDGEIKDLKTNIYVTSLENPSRDRRLVIENGGWPSLASENIIFFHRKVADNWGVFRFNLSGHCETVRQVTPKEFDAVTPAAIDENRVVVATIRQKSKFTDVRNESQFRHIEIFDINGPPLQVTQNIRALADHFNPFVMEDGKYIGYHRCRSDDLQHGQDIERNLDKVQSPHENVGLFRVPGVFPTFSKDGSKLAFVDNEFKAVWVADSQGLRVVFETNGPDSIFSPVWNQKKDILYVCMGPSFKADATVEIHAIPDISRAEGARRQPPRVLTKGKFNNAFPFTNPEGTKFVFRSTRDAGDKNYKNLYIMEDAEFGEVGGGSGNVTRLTRGDWIDTQCQWSPDGKLIVFASDRDKPAGAPERDHGLDPGYFAVYLMRVADRSVVRVIRSGYDLSGHVNHPVFSPDGRSIAVTSDLAAVSADPMSLPTCLHSIRPYGDIFSVDIDPDDMEGNRDVDRFVRLTHSRYENSTPAWTAFSTHEQWNLRVMEDEYTPACPYAHPCGAESWHMTGQICIPKRPC